MDKITIMLAEDHHSVRESYINSLQEQPNFSIIGSADNGADLITLIEKDQPNIVILDIEMPVMNGYQTLDILSRKFPKIRPIVLSAHYSDYDVAKFIDIGACAYLPKSCFIRDLITAINDVNSKGVYFSKKASQAIASGLAESKKLKSIYKELSLSEREKDILMLICSSKTNREIAQELNIVERTVEFHRQSIYRKTNSQGIVDLVKYAIKNGFLKLD